jgi:hypothetical protein
MSAQTLPVAVHRWFADKEGWAYHTTLRDHVAPLIDAMDSELKARGEGVFSKAWPYGWLLGERVLDRQCLNEDAAKRAATIIRVTMLTQEPSEREKGLVLAALRRVPLPSVKGPSDKLVLSFEPPPTLPAWSRAEAASGGFWSRLFSSGPRRSAPPPMAPLELARRLEGYWKYHLDAGSFDELRPMLAESWRGVTAAGRIVRRADFSGPGRIPPTDFPALLPDRGKAEVILQNNVLVVAGEALLRDQRVRSVHVYALRVERETWEMIAATVTPLAVEAVAALPAAHPVSPGPILTAGLAEEGRRPVDRWGQPERGPGEPRG